MKSTSILFLCGILLFSFFSCKDDSVEIITDQNTVNKWIAETMRKNYYWYQDIPNNDQLNFDSSPSTFFQSLLSTKDGKPRDGYGHGYYSTIKSESTTRSTAASGELSLGFEYNIYPIKRANITQYLLKVIYILPNSPASRSTLKRGDWIHTINGQSLTLSSISTLKSQAYVRLGIGPTSTESGATDVITLSAQTVENNPVYLDTTYYTNNKKIAYLVYNQFASGPTDSSSDETFNNSLRQAFTKFKSNSPDEFILDLRYNGGGLVTCAQILATLLAPESALGDVFCNLTYNDKLSKSQRYTLDQNIIKKNGYGENLNLKRLYVIVSSQTASASEAVINGLKPYLGDNLILVGEQTEGKNVGSLEYKDNRFSWVLHPIVCLVSNKNNFSDYSNGFTPDIPIEEPSSYLKSLGDTQEIMLNSIINMISGIPLTNVKNTAAEPIEDMTLIGSSLDRNKTNGVILPPQE